MAPVAALPSPSCDDDMASDSANMSINTGISMNPKLDLNMNMNSIAMGPDPVARKPSFGHRKFALYASRIREREASDAANTIPANLPTSASMQGRQQQNQQLQQAHPDDYAGYAGYHSRSSSDDSLQLSQLPPLPISPRWDSLSNGSRFLLQMQGQSPSLSASASQTSSLAAVAAAAAASNPASPMASPREPPPHSPYTAAAADSRTASPTFPQLASKSSLADLRAYDSPSAAASPVSPLVENFSRPRKQSIRQPITDAAKPQPRPAAAAATATATGSGTANTNPTAVATAVSTAVSAAATAAATTNNSAANPTANANLIPASDPYQDLVSSSSPPPQQAPWSRPRGPSVSSCKSSATFASTSILSPPPSADFLEHRPSRARATTTTAAAAATPPPASSRLPLSFSPNRIDGNAASSPIPSPVVAAPWMNNEELRSSFRSQLTESTAPGTAVTERSSVLTKDSSVTSLYATADDDPDEPSLEDVMGMYEKGFGDDDESDADENYYDAKDSHPGTAASYPTPRYSTAEPLADSEPELDPEERDLAPATIKAPTSALDAEIRMSKMIFTSSAFTSSVPHIAENLARKSIDKRDSGKSLDSEPSIASRQPTPVSDPVDDPEDDSGSEEEPPTPAPTTPISPAVSPPTIPVAEPEEPDSRDRYGFKKANQYITREQYDTWNKGYTEYLARRRKKWVAYLKDNALMTDDPNRFPAPNAKTKRFVRKGIPPDWRGAAWFYYAGGPAILAQHSGLYDKLTTKEAKEVDAEAIERDLHRTFPDNVKFKPPSGTQTASSSERSSQSTMTDSTRSPSPFAPPGSEGEPPIITSLRRVLHAFSVYNPRIGYCQSLNFLAGLLLLFVDTEEQCFWLLNVITRIYLPGTHEMSLEGSKVDLGVLMTELRDTMPAVWDKIGGELEADHVMRPTTSKSIRLPRGRRRDMSRLSTERLPPITLCMTAWFMSCFIGTLPIETTLRVWDVFFYEGSKTLFRIALSIFKLGENEIKSVADPMEMFGVVQALPRRLIDANGLIEACFKRRNGFGHLSQETIDLQREERRNKAQLDRLRQGKSSWNVTSGSDTEGPKRKNTLFSSGKKRTATGI